MIRTFACYLPFGFALVVFTAGAPLPLWQYVVIGGAAGLGAVLDGAA